MASIGKVEAVGPDYKPLTPTKGTMVNFTVGYWRRRRKSDEYTTSYYWTRPPRKIKEIYLSEEVPLDKDGTAMLKISSFPESAISLTIEARVSLMSKRLDI